MIKCVMTSGSGCQEDGPISRCCIHLTTMWMVGDKAKPAWHACTAGKPETDPMHSYVASTSGMRAFNRRRRGLCVGGFSSDRAVATTAQRAQSYTCSKATLNAAVTPPK